jgi:hypothetical protein
MLHCVSHDDMVGSHNAWCRSIAAEAVTFEAPKVTKSASQQKCFFAAQGLCAANQAKPGLQYFCPEDPFALRPRMQNIAMPCRPHGLHCFA